MFASERLSRDHVLDSFECGKPVLDRWLKQSALDQQERHYSHTYVWTDGSVEPVAYFTLLSHSLDRSLVSSRLGRGGPESIPTLLIAKLALAKPLHSQKLGGQLLVDALSRCCAAMDVGPGARFVLVDALDGEAESFYRHYDFKPIKEGSRTLYRKTTDICADL